MERSENITTFSLYGLIKTRKAFSTITAILLIFHTIVLYHAIVMQNTFIDLNVDHKSKQWLHRTTFANTV